YPKWLLGASSLLVWLKGEAEMATTGLRVHELAAGLKAYVEAKGQFPRGTVERPQGERFVAYGPDQRLSWMFEVLPFLPGGDFKGLSFKGDEGWSEGDNLLLAQMVVPQFAARMRSDSPYRSRCAGLPVMLGATRFIGV